MHNDKLKVITFPNDEISIRSYQEIGKNTYLQVLLIAHAT